MWTLRRGLLAVALLSAVVATVLEPAVLGQQTAAGAIAGTVRDASGAGLPGVTVTVLLPDGATVASTTTDSGGAYTLSVPPGTYRVRTRLVGFRESQAIVTVTTGSRTELPFNIRVGELQDRSPELAPPFANRGDVYIRADAQTRDGNIIRYRGNVLMRTDGSEISADELDFNVDTRTADARGDVKVRVLPPEFGVVPLTQR